MPDTSYYTLAAGVDVVPLSDAAVLFRSNTLAVRVEGGAVLADRVLPLLAVSRSLDELQSASELPREELRQSLDALVDARVLDRTPSPMTQRADHPFAAFVQALGVDPGEAAARMRAARIAIFGLEAHGAHLALELARLGIGACVLADPFPMVESDELLGPRLVYRPGLTRQQAVADALAALAPETTVTMAGELTRESVQGLAEGAGVVVGCFDRGYETAQHWVNRAAIATGTPALFAEIRTHVAIVGPCVIPGQSSCYMCYRMRRIACEDNYEEAMAYERFLNERKQPALSSRATAPFLPARVASILAGEVVKLVALGLPATLAGRVNEFDTLSLESTFHQVLRQPDCPVCGGKKKRLDRDNLTLEELLGAERSWPSGDLRVLGEQLVSARTGVVRRLEAFVKDPTEPAVPYIVRADVANHRFATDRDDDDGVCSGKGLTLNDARVSALGEAVERYSGAVHAGDEVRYATRSELAGRALDPRALVLYEAAQYPTLPYAPYRDDSRLGWVASRSLVTGEVIQVPALAVFMNYHAHEDGEFLFPITSNGLATGRTLLDAVWAAAAEVLERDAFMIAWLNRLPARRYSARAHPHQEIAALAASYERRGVEVRLYRLPSDHAVAVFAAVALEAPGRGGPAAVIGLGADPDPVLAARKAVLEVSQVRPSLRRRMRRPETQVRLRELLDDPHRVTTIDDHDLLYASHESLHRLAFWLDVGEEAFEWEAAATPTPSAVHLASLVRWLGGRGGDLLYVNLTPTDMGALGLYTARAILPGFQPIDFGWKERRLGGSRLHRLPMALGFRDREGAWNDLNDDPHPLA
jgi:ribosomal protein S12 methylthiotransferase accessory factor